MSWFPPGILVGALLIVVLSGLFAALMPRRRSRFLAVLLLTAAGVLAGQAWDALGLPALRLGEANLLPAALFAAVLQPLAERVSLRLR